MSAVTATVVNVRSEEADVMIDRSSRWGNPYRIGRDGDRAEVIRKYKQHLWEQMKAGEVTEQDLLALKDYRLGCWCKPAACHGDVLIAAIEWVVDEVAADSKFVRPAKES